MKKHPQEKYQHIKSGQVEYFTFIGEHIYQRSDGKKFTVTEMRRRYRFISTLQFQKDPPPHQKWEHNPATGFNVRRSYVS